METTKMFKAKIQVKKNDKVKLEYNFSDKTKEKLYVTAINYFYGYIEAIGDFSKIRLYAPDVMSLDGFQAWSKDHSFTVRLLNEKGDIIAKEDDII